MTTPDKPAIVTTGANRETGLQVAGEHALIGRAANLPVSASTPVVSVSPVTLSAPGRIVDLQMRRFTASAALGQTPGRLGKVESKSAVTTT